MSLAALKLTNVADKILRCPILPHEAYMSLNNEFHIVLKNSVRKWCIMNRLGFALTTCILKVPRFCIHRSIWGALRGTDGNGCVSEQHVFVVHTHPQADCVSSVPQHPTFYNRNIP